VHHTVSCSWKVYVWMVNFTVSRSGSPCILILHLVKVSPSSQFFYIHAVAAQSACARQTLRIVQSSILATSPMTSISRFSLKVRLATIIAAVVRVFRSGTHLSLLILFFFFFFLLRRPSSRKATNAPLFQIWLGWNFPGLFLSKYASIDRVAFSIWRHTFKLSPFHAERRCHLVSAIAVYVHALLRHNPLIHILTPYPTAGGIYG